MISALKYPATGVTMLRNVTSPTVSSFESCGGDKCCGTINWSQKRFLRCLPPSSPTTEGGNVNAQFTVNEIENQHKRLKESSVHGNKMPNSKGNVAKENYSRSVRNHQSYLMTSLPGPVGTPNNKLIAKMCKIIIENGSPTVRVKNNKDGILVKEWIGIQNELQTIKEDRIEEDKRRLQIAGQQVLREMEASLRKGMNLEDLDEAIEGALCSELKDQ